MAKRRGLTRRTALKLAGVTASTVALAGCGGDGDGNGNGNGDGGNGGNGGSAISGGTRIVFEAQTAGWVGVEPGDVADAENPALTLTAGESYEIGWQEGDGSTHNMEIRDDSDEVVDGLETDEVSEPESEDSQFLEFEASDEMAAYVCDPHEGTMNGDLQIE